MKDIWQRFYIEPVPDDLKPFRVQFNPTIELQAEDTGQPSYTFTNPPSSVPGVTIRTAQIELDLATGQIGPGSSVEMELDMAGAFTTDTVTKEVTSVEAEIPTGDVDNSFGDLRSTLTEILGEVTVDACLIDGGIQATVTLAGGPAQALGSTSEAPP